MNELMRPIFDLYHSWYYDTAIYQRTSFLGVPVMKSVLDLWNYQEILSELRPRLVIEFGSFAGGSALFFAVMLRALRPLDPDARVISVDVCMDHIDVLSTRDRGIIFVNSPSTSGACLRMLADARRYRSDGACFAILDSDHVKDHVLDEMKALRPILQSGDCLVVEDGNVNGHPVLPSHGPGPFEAIEAYEAEFPNDYVHDTAREEKFGFTFAPRGFLTRR